MEEVANPLEIDSDLTCFVCNLEFQDPRFLPCHHYFCAKCIDQMAAFATPFGCPTCGAETALPEGSGAGKLPQASIVLKIKKHLEAARVLEAEVPNPCVFTCTEHDIQQRLYCCDCSRLVCSECTLTCHRGHRYEFVKEAAPKFRDEIAGRTREIATMAEGARATAEQLNERKREVTERAQQAKVRVNKAFDDMQRALDERRETLLRAVDELTDYHVSVLDGKVQSVQARAESLDQLLKVVGKCTATSDEEYASSYLHLLSLLQSKKDDQSVFNIEPADIVVDITCVDEIRRVSQAGAKVLGPSLLMQNSSVLELGKTTPLVIHHVALTGNKPAACRANLVSLADQLETPAKVTNKRNGAGYEVHCNPKVRGRHHLFVEVGGSPILGSPFPVFVSPSVSSLGKQLRVIRPVTRPTAVAFDNTGQMLITEREVNKVSVRDKKGIKLKELRYSFQHPWGVAVDQDNCIYISEHLAHRVTKFDGTGKFLKSAGKQGSGNLEFYYPKGVHVVQDKVYICDGKNDRVQVLDRELKFLQVLSHSVLKSPITLTSSSSSSTGSGYLFVVGNCPGVHVFSTIDHTYLYSVEHEGLAQPSGVCYSSSQAAVYVCDSSPSTAAAVHVFQCSGLGNAHAEFAGSFGRKGVGGGLLGIPTGVQLDEDCYLYVCDSENDRVIVF